MPIIIINLLEHSSMTITHNVILFYVKLVQVYLENVKEIKFCLVLRDTAPREVSDLRYKELMCFA